MTLGNQQLRILYIHKPGCWNTNTWIMDKIGCEKNLLPEYDCNTPMSPGYGLRCYYDATGLYYSTHLAPYCDYTSHDTYSDNITIYTDPSGITITSNLILAGTHIHIYDDRGRLVGDAEGNDNHIAYLPIATLSKSIYLAQIENGSTSKSKKFISY